MGTNFMFCNVVGEWPDDYCAIRNMERHGDENAQQGFRLVIERNGWAAEDTIVAAGVRSSVDVRAGPNPRSGWRGAGK